MKKPNKSEYTPIDYKIKFKKFKKKLMIKSRVEKIILNIEKS